MDEYAARRGSARLPISAAIKLRYPGVEDFFDETVGDIGMAGMFVQSESPMPAGTLMHFELRPSPQWRTLRGRGRVVWARHQATEPGKPTGMGVRFIELDERARRGIRWLIETYQAVGDRPFETWTIPHQFARPGGATAAALHSTQKVEPLPEAPETQPLPAVGLERAKATDRAAQWPWLAAGLVLLAGFGWLLLREPQGSAPEPVERAALDASAVETPTSDQSAAASAPAAPTGDPVPAEPVTEPKTDATASTGEAALAATAPPGAPVDPEPPPAAAQPQLESVLAQLVGEWAAAWSSQDPARYLAFYAEDFVPDRGFSRSAWERQRRQRLRAPQFVQIDIENIQVLETGSDTPRTVFTQRYESDTFSDQVTKSLTWGRSDASWRIISERSAP